MYYGIKIKRTIIGSDGNDKVVAEDYLTDVELFCEAENNGYQEFNGECDVVAIKRLPTLREFVNEPTEDTSEYIYMATLIDTFVNEDGSEVETKYNVAVYAENIDSATKKLNEYMRQGLDDLTLVSIKRTKIVSVL